MGTTLDINKNHQVKTANRINNITLILNVFLVAINVVISVFDSKDKDNLLKSFNHG